MIFMFSCFKKDMTGEKYIVAFKNFPQWQHIQQAAHADAEVLNFYGMKPKLDELQKSFANGPGVFAWEYEGFVCQMFSIELVENPEPPKPKTLSQIIEIARGGPAPSNPMRTYA